MDLGELNVFLTVAREKSFSRAAERLYRTQPAVSIAIRKLEEWAGQALVVRRARSVELTDAGALVAEYAEHSPTEVEAAIGRAHEAFLDWRHQPFAERSRHMHKAAELLEGGRQRLAELMAVEMGKPVKAGRAEGEKSAWACRYYADEAANILADVAYAYLDPRTRER